jgi:DNA repair protein RecO (recombination protein O)
MLEKTRAIILHKIKYTDSGIVVHAYTRKFGRQSVLVRGIGKKKAGRHSIMFQPLFILDTEIYYKPSRDMQTMKDASIAHSPYGIQSDIMKSSVAMFLGEVLSSVLHEEIPNEEMFDFIENSIVYFDGSKTNYANFHIAFLTGLSSYLGFEPSPRKNEANLFFDMRNGNFVPLPPNHGDYANEQVSAILASFFSSSYDSAGNIVLNGKQRNEVLEVILKYYFLHLPVLKKIKSLEVLKEVFG